MLNKLLLRNKFSLLAVVLFIFYGYDKANIGIDIQVHDTYYVIAIQHITTLIALVILLVSVIYFSLETTGYQVSKKLKTIHIVSSILLLLITIFIYNDLVATNGLVRYYTLPIARTSIGDDRAFWINSLIAIGLCLLVFTLILIGWNFLSALIKGKGPMNKRSDDSILDD